MRVIENKCPFETICNRLIYPVPMVYGVVFYLVVVVKAARLQFQKDTSENMYYIS